MGAVLEGEMPSWETLQNNAIILGGLGFVEAKASKMVSKSAEKNKTEPLNVIEEVMKNLGMKQEIGSKNIKNFSKDKELDKVEIKKLKKAREKINEIWKKSGLIEVVEDVQVLSKRLKI